VKIKLTFYNLITQSNHLTINNIHMRTGITFSLFVMFAGILTSRGQDAAGWCDTVLSHSKDACTHHEFSVPIDQFRPMAGNDSLFAFDDGSAELGVSIIPGKLGWLGNYFPVSPTLSGYLDTLYVWFWNNPGGSGQTLTIDVFDSNRVIKGFTPGFLATSGAWLSVPAPDIPFSGPFYIMVKWDHLPNPTHWLGYDENGPYSPQNLGRYRDSTGTWSNLVVALGLSPGVFLARAHASVYPLGIPGLQDRELPLVYPNPARDKVTVSLREGINSVKVLTLAGNVMLEFHFNGKNHEVIDLSSLPGGVYLLSVSAKSGTTTSKIILLR
jgi:hypothetical protein